MKDMIHANSFDNAYRAIDKSVSAKTVLVWKMVHNPPKVVRAVINAGISQQGSWAVGLWKDKNKPNPLVNSMTEPKMELWIHDKSNVYKNILFMILNKIMYPPIFTCISKAERMHLSKIDIKVDSEKVNICLLVFMFCKFVLGKVLYVRVRIAWERVSVWILCFKVFWLFLIFLKYMIQY